jgi:uncharacterized protein YjbJ (UPF0337 family)
VGVEWGCYGSQGGHRAARLPSTSPDPIPYFKEVGATMGDNKDETRGTFDNLKGRIKQAAGAITGDKKLEAEGAGERVKGAAEKAVGKATRKVEEATASDDADEDIDTEDPDKV